MRTNFYPDRQQAGGGATGGGGGGGTNRTYQFVFDLLTKGNFGGLNNGVQAVEKLVNANQGLKDTLDQTAQATQVGADTIEKAWDQQIQVMKDAGNAFDIVIDSSKSTTDRLLNLGTVLSTQVVGGFELATIGVEGLYNALKIPLVGALAAGLAATLVFGKAVSTLSGFLADAGAAAYENQANLSHLQQAYNVAGKSVVEFSSQYELAAERISRGKLGDSFGKFTSVLDGVGAASVAVENKIYDTAASFVGLAGDAVSAVLPLDTVTKNLKGFAEWMNRGIIGEADMKPTVAMFENLDTSIAGVTKRLSEIARISGADQKQLQQSFLDLSNSIGDSDKALAAMNLSFEASRKVGFNNMGELIGVFGNLQKGIMLTEEETRKYNIMLDATSKVADSATYQAKRLIQSIDSLGESAQKAALASIITPESRIAEIKEELERRRAANDLTIEYENQKYREITSIQTKSNAGNRQNAEEALQVFKRNADERSKLAVEGLDVSLRANRFFYGELTSLETDADKAKLVALRNQVDRAQKGTAERIKLEQEYADASVQFAVAAIDREKNKFDEIVSMQRQAVNSMSELGLKSSGQDTGISAAQKQIELIDKTREASSAYYADATKDSKGYRDNLVLQNQSIRQQYEIISSARAGLTQFAAQVSEAVGSYAISQGAGIYETAKIEEKIHKDRMSRIQELLQSEAVSEVEKRQLRLQSFEQQRGFLDRIGDTNKKVGAQVLGYLNQNEESLRKQSIAQNNILDMISQNSFKIDKQDPYRTYQLQQGGGSGAAGKVAQAEAAAQAKAIIESNQGMFKNLERIANTGDSKATANELVNIRNTLGEQTYGAIDATGEIESRIEGLLRKTGVSKNDPATKAAEEMAKLAKQLEQDREVAKKENEETKTQEADLRKELKKSSDAILALPVSVDAFAKTVVENTTSAREAYDKAAANSEGTIAAVGSVAEQMGKVLVELDKIRNQFDQDKNKLDILGLTNEIGNTGPDTGDKIKSDIVKKSDAVLADLNAHASAKPESYDSPFYVKQVGLEFGKLYRESADTAAQSGAKPPSAKSVEDARLAFTDKAIAQTQKELDATNTKLAEFQRKVDTYNQTGEASAELQDLIAKGFESSAKATAAQLDDRIKALQAFKVGDAGGENPALQSEIKNQLSLINDATKEANAKLIKSIDGLTEAQKSLVKGSLQQAETMAAPYAKEGVATSDILAASAKNLEAAIKTGKVVTPEMMQQELNSVRQQLEDAKKNKTAEYNSGLQRGAESFVNSVGAAKFAATPKPSAPTPPAQNAPQITSGPTLPPETNINTTRKPLTSADLADAMQRLKNSEAYTAGIMSGAVVNPSVEQTRKATSNIQTPKPIEVPLKVANLASPIDLGPIQEPEPRLPQPVEELIQLPQLKDLSTIQKPTDVVKPQTIADGTARSALRDLETQISKDRDTSKDPSAKIVSVLEDILKTLQSGTSSVTASKGSEVPTTSLKSPADMGKSLEGKDWKIEGGKTIILDKSAPPSAEADAKGKSDKLHYKEGDEYAHQHTGTYKAGLSGTELEEAKRRESNTTSDKEVTSNYSKEQLDYIKSMAGTIQEILAAIMQATHGNTDNKNGAQSPRDGGSVMDMIEQELGRRLISDYQSFGGTQL